MRDMLGIYVDFRPKFVRRYLEGFSLLKEAVGSFDRDVKSGEYPSEKESY